MKDDEPKRSPADLMKALRGYEADPDVEKVLAMSPQELEKELREAGLDPEAIRQRGRNVAEETLAQLEARAAEEIDAPPPSEPNANPAVHAVEAHDGKVLPFLPPSGRGAPRTVGWGLVLRAVAAVLVLAIALSVWLGRRQGPKPRQEDEIATTDAAIPTLEQQQLLPEQLAADDLRHDALVACAAERWAECARKLDQAKELDPAGEGTSIVKGWRETMRAVAAGDGGRRVDEQKKGTK